MTDTIHVTSTVLLLKINKKGNYLPAFFAKYYVGHLKNSNSVQGFFLFKMSQRLYESSFKQQ